MNFDDSNNNTSSPNKFGSGEKENYKNNLETLEPYQWTTASKRNGLETKKYRNRNRNNVRNLEAFNKLFNSQEEYYEKYYDLRFPATTLDDISVIKLSKDIKKKIGELKKVVKSSKNSLLVETSSRAQSETIINIDNLAGNNVLITKHRNFNQIKGVIRTRNLQKDTEDEILEYLAAQSVTDVRRIKRRVGDKLEDTNTYILSFSLTACPKMVKLADWNIVPVEEYKYTPLFCFKCEKFGHIKKYCRQTFNTCSNCGQSGHVPDSCTSSDIIC